MSEGERRREEENFGLSPLSIPTLLPVPTIYDTIRSVAARKEEDDELFAEEMFLHKGREAVRKFWMVMFQTNDDDHDNEDDHDNDDDRDNDDDHVTDDDHYNDDLDNYDAVINKEMFLHKGREAVRKFWTGRKFWTFTGETRAGEVIRQHYRDLSYSCMKEEDDRLLDTDIHDVDIWMKQQLQQRLLKKKTEMKQEDSRQTKLQRQRQRLRQILEMKHEGVYGRMKQEPGMCDNDLMIKTKCGYPENHNKCIILKVGNSDNTPLGISQQQLENSKAYTHSLSDETKQDFEFKDDATVRQSKLSKNETRLSQDNNLEINNETTLTQDNLEINNETTLSQDNMQINNQREHPISSDQTREAPRPHSTMWKMLGRNLPILTVLMAVYILSHHNVLITSIVGLFFIQIFANNIYCVFFDCKNDETIRNNYPADLVRRAMGLLVPMMLIQLQLAAVVMWQFHETHLVREPQLNELPSFVVLGLMTFHVLLQFTFHVIDFTRLLV